MIVKPSVLCPIDFSDASRGALRYAGAIAEHFGARLHVLAVNDALLDEAAAIAGDPDLEKETSRQIERFCRQTFSADTAALRDVRIDVATGKAAAQILRVARERSCDLIVMSSHGLTGFRKVFFGSTTERVLRETTMPVLVTPGGDPGPAHLEDARGVVRRILAPVDLTQATAHQLSVARGLAEALKLPLLLLHVIPPARSMVAVQTHTPHLEAERRYRVEKALGEAVDAMPASMKPEPLLSYGEPSEEIAKVAADRDAGLIVMGLHSSPLLGPRMGSVTYRVLCLAHRLVLALPPLPAPAARLSPIETVAVEKS
jgi:nucleotide-binding universal stress UspA family protein